jgi:hypothetical protein
MGQLVMGHLPATAIVNNPTQLLFAIEAAAVFDEADVSSLRVIVIPTPGARDGDLYRNVLRAAGVTDVEWLGTDALSRAGRLRDARRFRSSTDRAAHIITPMIHYFPARALLNRAGRNAVITDDGTWTVHFAGTRSAGKSQFRTPLHALLPFGALPRSLNFFTIYPELVAGPSDIVRANQLAWSRETFHSGQQGDHMVILGSDLARSEYLSEETFERRLGALRAIHDGPAEYWPHRRENSALAERICRKLGMTLRDRTLPLEAEILDVTPGPVVVGTLPSTATRTLRLLKPVVNYQIVVAGVDERDIFEPRRVLFNAVSSSAETDADVLI